MTRPTGKHDADLMVDEDDDPESLNDDAPYGDDDEVDDPRQAFLALGQQFDPDADDEAIDTDDEDEAGATKETASPPATTSEQPSAVQPVAPESKERLFTQADVDRIIGQNKKAQSVRQLEAMVGMKLEEFVSKQGERMVAELVEETGMDVTQAQQLVAERQELAVLREARDGLERERAAIKFERERDQTLRVWPTAVRSLVAKYDSAIRELAKNGEALPFDVAAQVVLGQKLTQGEALAELQRATEQTTLANVQARNRTAVESGKAGAGAPESLDPAMVLDPMQRHIARAMGVPLKDVAKAQRAINRMNNR